MFNIKILKQKQGISLLLVVMVMAILLAISLGISAILISQMKVTIGMGNSVLSFYAADAGIEEALYYRGEVGDSYSGTLENGASYQVEVIAHGTSNCPADVHHCINSVGSYLETKRAIQVRR